ncbi:hypothetical protein [Paraburkholderia domus]|uniref:hypothetical protein n=1 Tax=Paraburkholderia domus TaxID=2793075 RepID=UPI001912962C|nr:hypothetical protein [Paraburkholderia domus]MBK5182435.1 hypothetical protein [Burkholderia sp. R-69749]MCI0147298.1 hypothetical protein [Paraburkholderia sediminicola]
MSDGTQFVAVGALGFGKGTVTGRIERVSLSSARPADAPGGSALRSASLWGVWVTVVRNNGRATRRCALEA